MALTSPTHINAALPLHQLNETSHSSTVLAPTSARPFEHLGDKALAQKLLTHFNALEVPGAHTFSTYALTQLSEGVQRSGQSATQEQVDVAREMLQRPELVNYLDILSRNGYEDGKISWNDIALFAGDIRSLSDQALLLVARSLHNEFDSTGNGYVNFNELKEAAGTIPSNRTFTELQKKVAHELLERPTLLRKLDIGVSLFGFPGKEDGRYDETNLEYLISFSSRTPNRPFKSKTDPT